MRHNNRALKDDETRKCRDHMVLQSHTGAALSNALGCPESYINHRRLGDRTDSQHPCGLHIPLGVRGLTAAPGETSAPWLFGVAHRQVPRWELAALLPPG